MLITNFLLILALIRKMFSSHSYAPHVVLVDHLFCA
jgi:hypothetical protein